MKNSVKCVRNVHGKKLDDPDSIANCLNQHFGSIGKEMAKKFDEEDTLLPSPIDPVEYITKDVQHSVFLADTDSAEMDKILYNLNLKKSCDLFGISNKVIKTSSVVISPFLVKLYNACMRYGVFPTIFKTAQVIPLFKGGNRENVDCYRPISLLPILGKLFEKIISTRVVSFCDKFNLISPEQFGFRAKYSTEYAVLDIYEKLLHNLDTELSSCAIFLDLAKAFDSVSHDILLRKLQKYGFMSLPC